MSSGSKETTQTSSAEPWDASQGLLKTGLKDAESVYKAGTAFQPTTMSTVVPFSNQTMAGMGDIESKATAAMTDGTGMDKAYDFYSDMFNDGGLSDDQRSIADMWRSTAGGADLSTINPEFDNVLRRTGDDIRTQTGLSMSGAGRYGSGLHQGVLADRIGDVSSKMRAGEWERQLGRMDSSRTNLANLGQQGITNRFGAADALPGAYEATKAPAKDLMSIGTMYEDLMGRSMADRIRIAEEQKTAPLRAIEWINSIGTGAGSLGGDRSTVSTQPAPNPFLQMGATALGFNKLAGNPLAALFGG